jgi:hypothetical protein
MPLTGFYKVSFSTPLGNGAGVAFLRDGKIWGGDSMMFYTGTFEESGEAISGHVKTGRHTQVPGMVSVFGAPSVDISLRGTVTENEISFRGNSPQAPSFTATFQLSKLSD